VALPDLAPPKAAAADFALLVLATAAAFRTYMAALLVFHFIMKFSEKSGE
jgi:hypothetical protein